MSDENMECITIPKVLLNQILRVLRPFANQAKIIDGNDAVDGHGPEQPFALFRFRDSYAAISLGDCREADRTVHAVMKNISNRVFVFGSNRQGRHGKGAALAAVRHHGACYGQAEGLQGQSYAIVTKELRVDQPTVTLEEVAAGVARFLRFAAEHPELTFNVTAIGCGLAGFTPEQIKPLFVGHTSNVLLSEYLG